MAANAEKLLMEEFRTAAARVLMVDDDDMQRLLARTALENAGFGVIEAGDGSELLDAFHTHQPDIIVLDVLMPIMDGFDACAPTPAADTSRCS